MLKTELVVEAIMEKLLRLRRAYPDADICLQKHQDNCFAIHVNKLRDVIESRAPIQFVLPAFPAKSPNPQKTASMMPDLGECLGLKLLNQLAAQIHSIYPPGVEMVICSDGRVFNDLVLVSDAHVNAYSSGIKEMIHQYQFSYLTTFSLDDYYCRYPYEKMREELMVEFGESTESLKLRVKSNAKDKNLFNGIHRFIFEDQQALMVDQSKNQIREKTKEIAYEVIRRSNAWSRFVEKNFPHAVRLSIHPQPCGSEKFGIMLVKSADVWATPWHRVVIKHGNDHMLAKRKSAIELGAKPVFLHQQFSHYVLE